jgi:hypothetical protein
MKNLVMAIVVVAFVSLNACGQAKKEAPANIKTAFSQKFPKATKVKWENENDKEWEAEFKMDGKEYSASYDLNGAWMETENEISAKEIPAAVKTTLDKEFAGYKVGESEISENAEGKVYEFELKKGGDKLETSIDLTGKLIKKEQKKDNDKEDKD